MSINATIQEQFYQNLGKLFYAIAISDSTVEALEVKALKKMVNSQWSNDQKAFIIIDAFNWLNNDKEYTAQQCFKSFVKFKKANSTLFTEVMIKRIKKTAIAIASSFSKTNKSELMLLAKLEIELEKN